MSAPFHLEVIGTGTGTIGTGIFHMCRNWKDDNVDQFSTIPKGKFPELLGRLLEHDYSKAIKNGFATTGLVPFDPERLLRKLPAEVGAMPTSSVEEQLLSKLSDIRYNPQRAPRPQKKDRLPPGVSYTAAGDGPGSSSGRGTGTGRGRREEEESEEESESEPELVESGTGSSGDETDKEDRQRTSDDETDEEDRQRSKNVEEILKRIRKSGRLRKKARTSAGTGPVDEFEEEMYQEAILLQLYRPCDYVAAVYEDDWHIGQVLDKEVEPEADPDQNYVYLNFMEKRKQLRWPEKVDMLNVHRDDILCHVRPPTLTVGCSSSRSVSFQLESTDLKKVVSSFNTYQDYFLFKLTFYVF